MSIIVPILPLYAETLGASGLWIGLIFSGFSLARLLTMPIVGRLSDQRGRKAFVATGLLIYALVSIGLVVAETPVTVTLVRFGQGVAAAMIIPIAQAYMGDISPVSSEGKYMGLFSGALFAGFGVGPLMGGVMKDMYGMEASIYALSALTFSAFLLVWFYLPDLQIHRINRSSAGEGYFGVFKNSTFRGLITFRFTTAMCRGVIIAFVPLFAHDRLELSGGQIGLIISGNILVTSLLQMPCGLLADKISRRNLVLLGGFLFTCLICVLPLVRTFNQLLLLSLLSGAFGALVLPAATAIIVNQGRVYGMGAAMSLFNMSMSLGVGCGPPVAGLLADSFGIPCVFYSFGLIGFLGLGFFALTYQDT